MLRGVTLGVAAGDRIGIVGRNGDGKSTLLRLIAGVEEPDAGAVTRSGGLDVALLGQGDELDGRRARSARSSSAAAPTTSGRRDAALPRRARRAARRRRVARFPHGLDTPIGAAVRRRAAADRARASCCSDEPELLLLDEPTNHLDVEGVDWLARHLAARRGSMVVVTHDRWFLDAVCTATWEVADGAVHQYDGGYAAYVLARAEREPARRPRARSAASSCCARSWRGCGAGRRRGRRSRSSGSRPPTR